MSSFKELAVVCRPRVAPSWTASLWDADCTDIGPGTLEGMRRAVEDHIDLDQYEEFQWQQQNPGRWRLLAR